MSILTLTALVFAAVNFALCVAALRQDLRRKSIGAFYWVAAIGFGAYPLLVDAACLIAGIDDLLMDAYWDLAGGVEPYFDAYILARSGAFMLAFNLVFWLTARLLRPSGDRPEGERGEMAHVGRLSCWTLIIAGLCGTAYMIQLEYGGLGAALARSISQYGFRDVTIEIKHRYLYNLSLVFIYQSACGIYYGLRRRRPLAFVLACIPNVLLGVITAQRPFLVALLGPLAFYELRFGVFVRRSFQFDRIKGFFRRARRVAFLSLILLAIVFALNLVRTARVQRRDFAAAVQKAAYVSGGLRDCSVFVMYWTFEKIPEYLSSTGGESTLHLAKTILHAEKEEDPGTLVGFHLSWHRNAWTFTTLHPTVWGWAYCDLLWPGLLWGVLLAAMVVLLDRVTWRSEVLYFVLSPAALVMIVLVLRGSVAYGILRAWYASIITVAIVFFIRRLCAPAVRQPLLPAAGPRLREARTGGDA